MHHQLTVKTPQDTAELKAIFRDLYPRHQVFCFRGDLGAGKTTLIKELCRDRGVEEGVSSPTFSIVNEYSAQGEPIFHVDLYRLKQEEELLDIGWEDYLASGATIFVEWPEMAESFIPEDAVDVRIEVDADNEHRTITLTEHP